MSTETRTKIEAKIRLLEAASTRDRLAWDRVNALTRQLHS
jgi:hypothetical protein